jgi:hypothetical protein
MKIISIYIANHYCDKNPARINIATIVKTEEVDLPDHLITTRYILS